MRKRIRASPFTRRLAVLLWPNRVHFRCRLSGSFRCSPPRLTATQLLQVLTQNTVPDGRGLSPRRIVTLHSARVGALGASGGDHTIIMLKRQLQQVMEQIACERVSDFPNHLVNG
jgi:hypothetical protein